MLERPDRDETDISLPPTAGPLVALAGAGLRAALFAAGALSRLNERGLLSSINTFRAVGGASLALGLIARRWRDLEFRPSGLAERFDDLVERPLLELAAKGLEPAPRNSWLTPKLRRKHQQGDLSLADFLALTLERGVIGGEPLMALPDRPGFQFGSTLLSTGGAWEFRRGAMGEALLGGMATEGVSLAEAVAASMADVARHEPLTLRASPDDFSGGRWIDPAARRRVQLLDGGLADPLGLGSLWQTHQVVISIDGGEPLDLLSDYDDWLGNRLYRAMGISRHRARRDATGVLAASLERRERDGAVIALSTYHGQLGVAGSIGYPHDVVGRLSEAPADEAPIPAELAQAFVNHGYTLAETALRASLPVHATADVPLKLPYPAAVDRARLLGTIDQSLHPPKRRAG